jgi:hypothetical protein
MQPDVSLRVNQSPVFGETQMRWQVALSRSRNMNEFTLVSVDELTQIEGGFIGDMVAAVRNQGLPYRGPM